MVKYTNVLTARIVPTTVLGLEVNLVINSYPTVTLGKQTGLIGTRYVANDIV